MESESPKWKPLEIVNAEDAGRRLGAMFRIGGNDGIASEDLPRYADFLALLSDAKAFELALGLASREIWIAYNDPGLVTSPNRFSQAICKVGINLGFSGGDLRVLTAAASPQAFGALLEGKLLWKDSFALGHGEFAHSYQWLAAGLWLKWGAGTARLYQCTKGRLSIMPGWVKDDDSPKLKLRAIRLWEYLTDCTQWNVKLIPDLDAAKKWVEGAVINLCKPVPLPRSTNQWLENLLMGVITVNQLPGGLAITPLALQQVWDSPNNVAAAHEFVEQNAKLLYLIAQMLVDHFPLWCALSSPVVAGGSFRNANNVTALARSKGEMNGKWFICAYETRRIGKLLASQNAALIENIAQVMVTRVVVSQAPEPGYPNGKCVLTLQSRDGPLAVTIPGSTAVQDFLNALTHQNVPLDSIKKLQAIRDAFWIFVKTGHINSQPMSGGVKKNLSHTYQGTILSPMDALARGRQQHYATPTKTQQGWKTPSGGTIDKPIAMQGIFSLSPPGQATIEKDQVEITFHEVPGKLTKSVFNLQ